MDALKETYIDVSFITVECKERVASQAPRRGLDCRAQQELPVQIVGPWSNP